MCWNYRGYGKSDSSFFDYLNPYVCKADAERVLDFMVNKLKLKGKIGLYGRSLGGIASCHLANKYPDLIYMIIVDRTFADLDILSIKRLAGSSTKQIYNLVSCTWRTLNDYNLAKAKCYKILASDPKDDVVDNFASLPVGTAKHLAHYKYDEDKWMKFYDGLKFIFEIEDYLYKKMPDKTDD